MPRELDNPLDNIMTDLAELTAPMYKIFEMTPNQLTTISLIFGVLSSPLLHYGYNYASAFIFLLSFYFDTVDGVYARKYNMITVFGDYYDHICDILKVILLFYVMWSKIHIVLPVTAAFAVMTYIHLNFHEQLNLEQRKGFFSLIDIKFPPNKLKKYMGYTKYFSSGSITSVIMAFIIYWPYL